MDDGYEIDPAYQKYLNLAYDDLKKAPARRYTVEAVEKRKNRVLGLLLPFLDGPDENVVYRVAKLLAPGAPAGSSSRERKRMRPERGLPSSPFIDGLPFLETPEETDPQSLSVLSAVRESLAFLPAAPRLEDLKLLAWRLAGNTHRLAQLFPVTPWELDRQAPEWCLARVEEVTPAETFDGRAGFDLTCLFYSGLPAGLRFTRTFRAGFEAQLAKSFGLTKKDSRMVYPRELTNMTGYVLLQQGLGRSKVPVFRDTKATGSHQKHNRELYESRLDPARCPHYYKPEQLRSCMECPLAYEESAEAGVNLVCPLALRRRIDGPVTHTPVEATGGDAMVRTGA